MKEAIKKAWEEHPLFCIMGAGFFFRLLAVIFSKGYGMHDDHFLVIEAAQSWVDGYDYNYWLPSSGAKVPDGHSMFYSGAHYVIFLFLKWIGMSDPQGKMYIIRALHALWSMLTIYYGYKIAGQFGGRKAAIQAGLILALLFFFPMFSVRNLVEMVCIPPLVMGTWLLVDPEREKKIMAALLAGFLFGLAFNIRFQSLFFVGGAGLVLLFQKEWKRLILFSIACGITIFAVQGIADMMIWKRPFAEFMEYVNYNIQNSHSYLTGAWYQYIILICGILVPPISLLLVFGYVRSWKKYPMIFFPAFLFLVFHSMFPNKQERFILPVLPFVIILGAIGWNEYEVTSVFWQKRKGLLKGFWIFFWVLNGIALPVVSTTYSKKNRVEALSFLGHRKDLQGMMVEQSYTDNFILPPLYYCGKWNSSVEGVTSNHKLVRAFLDFKYISKDQQHPNYIIFFGKDDIAKRIADFKTIVPNADSATTIYPSFLDNVMEWLNPVNKNQTTYIYHFNEKDIRLQDSVAIGKSGSSNH